jgi:hypothetical protein
MGTAIDMKNLEDTTAAEWDKVARESIRPGMCAEADWIGSIGVQAGGSHYKDKKIQPLEFCLENEMDIFQFSIIKYATRMYDKGQCSSDLDKIIHYAKLAKAHATKRGIV